MAKLLIFVAFAGILAACSALGPMVNMPFGPVRGFLSMTKTHKQYASFNGIPYASPPIGDWRFRETIPHSIWRGELQANVTTRCPQMVNGEYVGSEDCLYLNIYVPTADPAHSERKFSVVFDVRDESKLNVEEVMEENVILVTFKYRLGPLGFMNMGNTDIPKGYLALQDHEFAYNWVHRYIHYFAGDEEVISLRGTNEEKLVDLDDKPYVKFNLTAGALGCKQFYFDQVVKCMRVRQAKQIVETAALLNIEWNEEDLIASFWKQYLN